MESKKTDLRVIKTRRAIMGAFREIIRKKPIEKVTVTEIAEKAMINKGTFYLHWQDVYALYDAAINEAVVDFCNEIDFYSDFFDKPKEFLDKLMQYLKEDYFRERFPYMTLTVSHAPLPVLITEELKKHIYALGVIEENVKNDIMLEYVLSGIFVVAFKYGRSNYEEMLKICSDIISTLYSARGDFRRS